MIGSQIWSETALLEPLAIPNVLLASNTVGSEE